MFVLNVLLLWIMHNLLSRKGTFSDFLALFYHFAIFYVLFEFFSQFVNTPTLIICSLLQFHRKKIQNLGMYHLLFTTFFSFSSGSFSFLCSIFCDLLSSVLAVVYRPLFRFFLNLFLPLFESFFGYFFVLFHCIFS